MNAAGNPSAEAERLLKRDAEWAELASAGQDIDRILSYWTDDAVVLAPHLRTSHRKDSVARLRGEQLSNSRF